MPSGHERATIKNSSPTTSQKRYTDTPGEASSARPSLTTSPTADGFIAVLINGDHFTFRDELLTAKDGGATAAYLLGNEILQRLPESCHELRKCRILIRVYANLIALSQEQTLKTELLVLEEERTLAPFAAAFTGAHELCDFIDVGKPYGNAARKVEENFTLFAGHVKCRHIYLAPGPDTDLPALLRPLQDRNNFITILSLGQGPHLGQAQVQLRVLGLNESMVFKSGRPKPESSRPRLNSTAAYDLVGLHARKEVSPTPSQDRHNLLHGTEEDDQRTEFTTITIPDEKNHQSTADNVSTSSSGRTVRINVESPEPTGKKSKPKPSGGRAYIRQTLPRSNREGLIPLNDEGQRIDILCPTPTAEDAAAFNKSTMKPCHTLFMLGYCYSSKCRWSHEPLDSHLLSYMKYYFIRKPCKNGTHCRRSGCHSGHICQRRMCAGKCDMPIVMHHTNTQVVSWVEEPAHIAKKGGSENSGKTKNSGVTKLIEHDSDGPENAWYSGGPVRDFAEGEVDQALFPKPANGDVDHVAGYAWVTGPVQAVGSWADGEYETASNPTAAGISEALLLEPEDGNAGETASYIWETGLVQAVGSWADPESGTAVDPAAGSEASRIQPSRDTSNTGYPTVPWEIQEEGKKAANAGWSFPANRRGPDTEASLGEDDHCRRPARSSSSVSDV